MISYVLALVTGALSLVLDQWSKHFIMTNYELYEGSGFIKGIIDIVYIHNRGGAWGIFQGKTWALLALTVPIMAVCAFLLFKYGKKSKLCFWSLSLIIFGGIGNMIDRIFRDGNVIDFLQFAFWKDFPVFNVADCAVVIGAGLLILYFVIDTVKDFKSKKVLENENN